jgi:predicted permease
LSQDEESSTISAQGHIPKDGEDANPTVNHILPGFFSTMGIPLIAGREFTTRDHFGAPKAAIINERFARQYFGHENPLGRHIGYGMGENGKFDIEIVGVVKGIREVDLKEKPKNQVWVPALADEHPSTMTFYVRTAMDPANMSNLLRQSVRQLDSGLPIYKVKTLDTQIRETHYVDRLISMLSAAFGIVATLLAGIGLYGVMAFTVARRTPELGIRMALGAQRSSVLRMIMLEVALLIAIGIGVALPTAFALGHYLRTQLFDIRPNDPVTMLSATFILIVVALLAGYIPARRATRIDPMAALRWE